MDEMMLGRDRYVSTRRASKISGYAQDYVGQLVRAGRVKATKVGKGWFVLEEGILKLAGKVTLPNPDRDLAILEQGRVTQAASLVSVSVEYPKTWSAVKYFRDDSPALPISDNRDTLGKISSIELLGEHTVRISKSITAGKEYVYTRTRGTTDENSVMRQRPVVHMSSFDGVRYAAPHASAQRTSVADAIAEVGQNAAVEQVMEKTLQFHQTDTAPEFVLQAGRVDTRWSGWLVRVAVSGILVSIVGFLIPIL